MEMEIKLLCHFSGKMVQPNFFIQNNPLFFITCFIIGIFANHVRIGQNLGKVIIGSVQMKKV